MWTNCCWLEALNHSAEKREIAHILGKYLKNNNDFPQCNCVLGNGCEPSSHRLLLVWNTQMVHTWYTVVIHSSLCSYFKLEYCSLHKGEDFPLYWGTWTKMVFRFRIAWEQSLFFTGSSSSEQQWAKPDRASDHRHSPGPRGQPARASGWFRWGEGRGAAVAGVQDHQAGQLPQRGNQDDP